MRMSDSPSRRGRWEIGARLRKIGPGALDRDPNILRAANGPWLVQGDADPGNTEFLQHEQRETLCQGLHQLELGRLDKSDDPLRNLLVIEGVLYLIADRRVAAVNRKLEID